MPPQAKNIKVVVQQALGLRPLSHHALGRRSVASQAVTNGHSIKAVQAPFGHRSEQSTHTHAHLGSRAQLRWAEALQPAAGTAWHPQGTEGRAGTLHFELREECSHSFLRVTTTS